MKVTATVTTLIPQFFYSNEEELMKAYHKYANSLLDIDSFDKELEIVKQKVKSKFPTFDFNIKPTTLSSYFENIEESFYAEKDFY